MRVANLSSIWTVLYTTPGRYNWMFQQYLRREGLALSWVGTGRLLFSLDYTAADFAEVIARFVRAAHGMREDGWWWLPPQASNRQVARALLGEVVNAYLGRGQAE